MDLKRKLHDCGYNNRKSLAHNVGAVVATIVATIMATTMILVLAGLMTGLLP